MNYDVKEKKMTLDLIYLMNQLTKAIYTQIIKYVTQ